jgi:hypothetical protein
MSGYATKLLSGSLAQLVGLTGGYLERVMLRALAG